MLIRTVAAAMTMMMLMAVASFGQAPAKPDPAKTLYHRMGGYDVLAGVTDDFLGQLKNDPAFARFGGGRASNSLVRARQLIVDQLCWLTDGPCVYIGRDMKTAHAGLKITEAEFESAGKKLKTSLDKFKVPEPEQQEFMALIVKLKPDIVESAPAQKPATN